MKPYVFGHRGASGYETENTISSFRRAVSMGAGVEIDVQLTKDNYLICFHDPYIKIKERYKLIKNFTLADLKAISFKDNRKIPLVKDVFDVFKDNSSLRYSFDIIDKSAGSELINIAEMASVQKYLEITDRRLILLSRLRRENKQINLVYTLPETIRNITTRTINLEKLQKLNIKVLNVRCRKNIKKMFKEIIDIELNCYIWGVNTKTNMKKVVNLAYKDEIVDAIYSDYPDKLLNMIREHYK
ncbi:MAG: glycerophosphodiester phosphodiesterase [Promethearchaeota archaeon]|jgi:glycerophosphoryl diester phosphodiesterase